MVTLTAKTRAGTFSVQSISNKIENVTRISTFRYQVRIPMSLFTLVRCVIENAIFVDACAINCDLPRDEFTCPKATSEFQINVSDGVENLCIFFVSFLWRRLNFFRTEYQ